MMRASGEGSGAGVLTEDAFLDGRLKVLQPEKGFRAGIDSVFVAAAVPAQPGDAVFEAGTGPGVAALCLLARVPDVHVTGVESDARYCMLAERNAELNHMSGRLRVIHGDVREGLRKDLATWPPHGSFAHAFANPPYYEEGSVQRAASALRAVAHAFGPEDLEQWIAVMAAMVAPRGTVTLIYRPEALGRILAAFDQQRLGDVRVAPLFPKPGQAASRIIVQGVKGSRAPMRLLPGLILHRPDGAFSLDAELVLRRGQAFPLR
jgi:tRNA1(Val) A37 N6-methylase TrmN6